MIADSYINVRNLITAVSYCAIPLLIYIYLNILYTYRKYCLIFSAFIPFMRSPLIFGSPS